MLFSTFRLKRYSAKCGTRSSFQRMKLQAFRRLCTICWETLRKHFQVCHAFNSSWSICFLLFVWYALKQFTFISKINFTQQFHTDMSTFTFQSILWLPPSFTGDPVDVKVSLYIEGMSSFRAQTMVTIYIWFTGVIWL